jgi:hypothetical protein
MKIKDLLSNVKVDKGIQNVANQVVIPLTTENPSEDLSEDVAVKIVGDTDYSYLTIQNESSTPTILPQGTSFITKQSAQDRAVKKAHILGSEPEKINVGCIQSSQGGHMSDGTSDYTFLPISLRSSAIDKVDQENYDVLWGDIEAYMNKVGLRGAGSHMCKFYEAFNKELEEFIAPFEPVNNQVGAIILINNQVAGIEIYPNYGAWRKVWRKLIRDSYGADAISLINKKQVAGYKPTLKIDNISSVDDIKNQVEQINVEIVKFIRSKVDTILQGELSTSDEETNDNFKSMMIKTNELSGQVITKGDKPVYVTLVKRMV